MAKQEYWCLLADAIPESTVVSDNPILTSPVEFVMARRKGDLIVLGRWDDTNNVGHVSALGIVTDVKRLAIHVDWRTVSVPLEPEPRGRQNWRKEFFCFSDRPAERYQLARHFAEHFPTPSPKPIA
ncbi:MAG TPA: hypothetical protein VGK29_02225 [Paludibaculum sp.]|jgi:hypothetical protein